MHVEVCIPWRDHPSRRRALAFTRAWWNRHGYQVRLLDTDDDPFNLAAVRNLAVRTSTTDVVVLADADTLPERAPLEDAIRLAADGHGTVLPYTEYRSLRADGSRQAYAYVPLPRCNHLTIPGACSGVYVTTRDGWASHHGQDERFAGWGCEDAAWWITHTTLLGEPRRVPGRVFALTHDSQDKSGEATARNFGRIALYEQAAGDPVRISELAREAA